MFEFKQLQCEILQALKSDNFEMFQILCEGEDQTNIIKIQQQLKDLELKKKMGEFVKRRTTENARQEQKDKIRKINAENSEQDDEKVSIFEQVRKKQKNVKIQQRFGYPFYGNVKCLMIAYGDLEPSQNAIKMMHSQLQTLKFQIFKQISTVITTEGKMKDYLCQIFPEEFQNYHKFKKLCKKATAKSEKDKESLSQNDFASDDQDQNATTHMTITTTQEKQYFFSLSSQMDPIQYQRYTHHRSVSFLQNKKNAANCKKFIKFLDLQGKINENYFDLEFLSFLLCRIVRKILFKIIRSRFDGKLKTTTCSIKMEEIKQFGNQTISEYVEIKTLYFKTVQEQAKKLFMKQFIDDKFYELIPKDILKNRKNGEQIWKQCKNYQKMWEQRLLAEKEVHSFQKELTEGERDPVYQYSKYLLKNLRVYKEMGKTYLWKNYFLQIDPSKTDQSKGGRSKKMLKLESLKK